MFMTEVLQRCSQMEQRVADIYGQCATSLKSDRELASFWRGMELEEKHHAKVLAAEKAALAVDSNPGYFMKEFSEKLFKMDRFLRKIEQKAQRGVTKDEAFALALDIEQSELSSMYQDLVIMGRSAVKLMERDIDESLAISKHRQEFVTGMKRFAPNEDLIQQADSWIDTQYLRHSPSQ